MKKRKLLRATAIFFAIMLVFTLLSRAADSSGVAVVTTAKPGSRTLSHSISVTGKIVQNQEMAITTVADLRISSIAVSEGTRVSEGDLLFELDEEYLDEQILYQEQELEIQKLNMDDIESQQSVSEQQKANEQASASEQYSFTVTSANLSLSRAKEALQEAKDALAAYREESGTTAMTDSSVETALMQAVEEKTEEYIAAQQELLSLQWKIEDAVNEALKEAQSSASLTGTSAVKTQSPAEGDTDANIFDTNTTYANISEATDEPLIISAESNDTDITLDNATETTDNSNIGGSSDTSEYVEDSIVINENYSSGTSTENTSTISDSPESTESASNSGNTDSGFIESIETDSDEKANTDTSGSSSTSSTENATGNGYSDSAIIIDDESESNSQSTGSANTGATNFVSTGSDSTDSGTSASGASANGTSGSGSSVSSDSASDTTQSQTLTQAELDSIEAAVRAGYSSDLSAAQAAVDTALSEKEAAEVALEEYEAELLEASGASASATESELIEAVKSAQEAYEDASLSANEATVSAARSLASANLAEASDSTLRQQEIAYERMEVSLNQLKELKETGGKVYATADGIVTKINITVGEKTSDSPAIMMADTSKGLRFTAELSEEEQQYIGAGDLVTLSWNSTKLENVEVTSVTADEEQDGVYNIAVQLPDATFDLGAAVTLEYTKKSSSYSLCVPLSALYLDENNQPYVYVTEEYETVMGTETRVRALSVVILEKDSSYAALEEGTLSSGQQVITGSSKSISDGSRVRVDES